jgi:hypothetical protein
MPDKNVQMPDGSVVAFPDSMSDDAIASVLKAQHPADKAPDTRNEIQKSFDANTQINPTDSLLQRGLKNVVGSAGAPFVHPIDSIMGLVPKDFATQYQQAQANPNKPTLAQGVVDAAGQGFGSLAAGAVVGAGLRTAAPAATGIAGSTMERVGASAAESGIDRINKTVGALQADFKHGSNLGRGYLENGIGPSHSMRSIATKADSALSEVGDKIGQSYDKANGVIIPVPDVIDALAKPLRNAHDLESGFGGSGNTAALEDYATRLKPELSKAYAKGGFTPKELFDLKQKLTKNINWKSSSDLETKLNNVREAQYGGLTDVLNDAVPGVRPLNQAYSDLKTLKKRADLRADTGSSPLTNFKEKGILTSAGAGIGAAMGGPMGAVVGGAAGLTADSVPFRTASASGLFRGGNALESAGVRVGKLGTPPASLPAIVGGAYALVNKTEGKNGNDNSDINQATPPQSSNSTTAPLKGQAKWAELGSAKLRDHINREANSELTAADVDAIQKTPQGNSLLIQASDLKPGSPAMKDIVKRIKALAQN